MDSRDVGLMITGFGIKLLGAGLAIWVAVSVATYVIGVFSKVSNALPM